MRRRYHTSFVSDNDGSSHPALEKIPMPRHVIDGALDWLEVIDRSARWYQTNVTITPEGRGLALEAEIGPGPGWVPRNSERFAGFLRNFGELRYADAPAFLRSVANELVRLCEGPRRGKFKDAYQPDGPWEYIAPEGPRDWRTRALWHYDGPIPESTPVLAVAFRLFAYGAIDYKPENVEFRLQYDYLPRSQQRPRAITSVPPSPDAVQP